MKKKSGQNSLCNIGCSNEEIDKNQISLLQKKKKDKMENYYRYRDTMVLDRSEDR